MAPPTLSLAAEVSPATSPGGPSADAGPSTSAGAQHPHQPPPPHYHVAAVDLGLQLEPETLQYWGYDDGTATLLVLKGGLVFAYDASQTAVPGSQDLLKWTFPLPDGPTGVRSMRLSLDGATLAIQRSAVLLELVDLATGNVFVQGSDKGKGEVLCFFFTELPGADVVLVTPAGLELYEWVPRRQGLRLRERVRVAPVDWAVYTHETRMVLLGTTGGVGGGAPGTAGGGVGSVALGFGGPAAVGLGATAVAAVAAMGGAGSGGQGGGGGLSYIKGFQFVSSGIVVLPPFTAGAAAAAAALGSGGPLGTALLASTPAAAAAVAAPPSSVSGDSVRLIKVYGRVYCVHINRRQLKLELYRFYTDTVVLQHTYELASPAVDLAVVDNLLLVVHTDASIALLIDVAAPISQPVANPLPMHFLRFNAGGGEGLPQSLSDDAPADPDAPSPAVAATAAGSVAALLRRWRYVTPNVVLDRQQQTLYRLAVHLPAVVESASDPAVAVGVLQRRRALAPPGTEPAAAAALAAAATQALPLLQLPPQHPRALLLSVVRNTLQERMPMTTVRAMMEELCAAYGVAVERQALVAAAGGGPAAAAAAAALPPPPSAVPMPQYLSAEELAAHVFRWLHDEEVVDAPYLQAALCEYKSAAVAVGLQLPAYLQSLSVETLLQQQQEDQVVQLLYSQAEHVADDVVQRLLALAPPPLLGPGSETSPLAVCRQMGVDALARRALGCRYEPVGGVGGSAAAAAAGPRRPAPVAAPPQGDAGEYVAALMQAREWLRAARVMRRYRVLKPSVRDFLAAVGAAGDEVVFSSCYRLFKDEVLSTYPKYELAARKLLAAGAQQQQTAAA